MDITLFNQSSISKINFYLTFHCIAHSPTPPFSTPSNRRFLNPNLFLTFDKIPIITCGNMQEGLP